MVSPALVDGGMVDISDQDKAAAQVWLQQAVAADAAGDAAAAEHGFLQALACDPDLSDAYFGLGVACFRASRYDQAASYLQAVVARGEADAVVHLLLGQSLYQLGRFRDSAAAFESARNDTPLAGETVRRYVRAHMFAAMIDGDVAGAIARYPAIAGSDADPITDVIREGFGLLSAYGHDKAALGLGEWLIAATPDDPVQRHLNDAVARRAIDSVPPLMSRPISTRLPRASTTSWWACCAMTCRRNLPHWSAVIAAASSTCSISAAAPASRGRILWHGAAICQASICPRRCWPAQSSAASTTRWSMPKRWIISARIPLRSISSSRPIR
ncbi:tetratricopeptide repeat protein [Tardiphaga alba]|uniref:Tetratricopeptide repeat protein n=1 Tax=Tardiphaga alba TaxID=340268 RepID=A0ABX8A4W6_9BRAD|nr:tetratricopeptide repeat protein [Tardiphaga alba]